MEKISIISVQDTNGGYTGWPKDRPNIIAEGNTYPELVQNVINLVKSVNEHENKIENKKK
jgi:predicted RNase H-like HicB family nuclease